jgi:hypothetical protein
MKKINLIVSVLALLISSLACRALTQGSETQPIPPASTTDEAPAQDPAVPTAASSDPGFSVGDFDFPMPDDATNVVNAAGTVNYQTKLSLDDVLKFYRDYYGSQGYTERELLTTTSDGVFSIVFDGDPSGKAVVIQGVDLGDGTVNVNISLQGI